VVEWELFEHDADIGVRGVGASLGEALAGAATALTAIVTDPAGVRPEAPVEIRVRGRDPELLLVDLLNAVIYEMATRAMLFSRFEVETDPEGVSATCWGETVNVRRHQPAVEPKGATFTALSVGKDPGGRWTAGCVVDV
jgi:SHS2 domain-containing protein